MFFLIGHRGVGKTNLINQLEDSIDLDGFISETHDIDEVFSKKGELEFRKIEKKCLTELIDANKYKCIALGAGFDLEGYTFPIESKFVWIQRVSDKEGRIFFDRPRLNEDLSAFEEFFLRKSTRDPLFLKFSDFRLCLEEGDFSLLEPLKVLHSIFSERLKGQRRGYFTPNTEFELKIFEGQIELRTDVFSKDKILSALAQKKNSKFLVSIKNEEFLDIDFLLKLIGLGALVDLPLEFEKTLEFSEHLLKTVEKESFFFSCHEKTLNKKPVSLFKTEQHLKWAPVVDSLGEALEFKESVAGKNVSFLPRSKNLDGSFKWLRLTADNKIEFYRYADNEYLDQPLYTESFHFDKKNIGAVLGSQTKLSWSPATHRQFFKDKFNSHYLNISCPKEFFDEALKALKGEGVRFLSVTSPFKKDAGQVSDLKLCNTLDVENVKGVFTDEVAIQLWVSQILEKDLKVLIWGSGAIAKVFKEKLGDRALLLSSRGHNDIKNVKGYDAVLWCAGTDADASFDEVLLTKNPSIKYVYDLDYKEHSNARALALNASALYISGKEFFLKQAQAQQKFFNIRGEI